MRKYLMLVSMLSLAAASTAFASAFETACNMGYTAAPPTYCASGFYGSHPGQQGQQQQQQQMPGKVYYPQERAYPVVRRAPAKKPVARHKYSGSKSYGSKSYGKGYKKY